MARGPETRYAWNGDVALAYQVFGAGPVDLVYLQGYVSHVDLNWASPYLARFLRGPARGVRCAQALVEAMRPLGLEIRAGLHTGEIEHGGNDLAGLAVHIGARVGAKAGPGEVWVSSTVKDLTAGSGLAWEDLGEHELKGVPDRWHLYRAAG